MRLSLVGFSGVLCLHIWGAVWLFGLLRFWGFELDFGFWFVVLVPG